MSKSCYIIMCKSYPYIHCTNLSPKNRNLSPKTNALITLKLRPKKYQPSKQNLTAYIKRKQFLF